jgi:hypothetical protein
MRSMVECSSRLSGTPPTSRVKCALAKSAIVTSAAPIMMTSLMTRPAATEERKRERCHRRTHVSGVITTNDSISQICHSPASWLT